MHTGTMHTGTMHSGTMISELMAMVERVELATGQQQNAEQQELQAIFAMQIPMLEGDQIYMGAA
jgi:hypothetical protein